MSPTPVMVGLAFVSIMVTTASEGTAQSAPEPGQSVALVTGSTGGLGREVALRLGSAGWHVIVHGRSVERGQEVVREIERAGGTARFAEADFASLSEVRDLAEAVRRDYERLDVLVNNAGIGSAPDERLLSEDGYELRFQVNYLAPFLLTHELLALVRRSAPSRIVNVSSLAQQPIDFSNVMLERGFSGGRAYAQSKLAQVLHTLDLHEELQGSGVLVNALHPATYMDTGMVRRMGVTPRTSVDEGAEAVLQLVLDDVDSGGFYRGLEPGRAHAQAYDAEARMRLKRLSEELTGIR